MTKGFALAALLLLAACGLRSGPPLQNNPKFVVGKPYQQNGVWRYPQAEYGVDQTGLATTAPDHEGQTADGEIFDQTAMAAGHRTLQLPAVVRVTNLENGRQIVVRLNDRGPPEPSRLLALTKRAAALLDMRVDGTRIRVQMLDTETRQLQAELASDGPKLDVARAPREAIAVEALQAPSGATQSSRVRVAATRPEPVGQTAQAGSLVPLRLPEAVTQVHASPANLFIDAGSFGRQDYASILVNRLASLGAKLTTSYTAPRDKAYRIRIGPLTGLPEAKAMLERTISAGVNDAAIVVE